MRKNRLIALIGTLTMAAAGLAAVSAGVLSKKAEGVNAWTTTTMYVKGDWDGWAGTKLTSNGTNDAYALVYMDASTSSSKSFKLFTDDDGGQWLTANNYGFHKDYSGPAPLSTSGNNMNVTPNVVTSGRVEVEFHFYNEYSGNLNQLLVYQKAAYTLTFNSNGGSSVSSIEKGTGASIAQPTDPTKSGFTFGGWYSNEGLTNPVSWPYTLNGNATLYAKWVSATTPVTMTFDLNGGSGTINPITGNSGTSYAQPANPTRNNYTFKGWSPALPDKMPAIDTTYVAQWELNRAVYLTGNFGTHNYERDGSIKMTRNQAEGKENEFYITDLAIEGAKTFQVYYDDKNDQCSGGDTDSWALAGDLSYNHPLAKITKETTNNNQVYIHNAGTYDIFYDTVAHKYHVNRTDLGNLPGWGYGIAVNPSSPVAYANEIVGLTPINPSATQYDFTNVSLTAGQVIYGYCQDGDVYQPYKVWAHTDSPEKWSYDTDDKGLVVPTTGTYSIYLLRGDNGFDVVSIVNESGEADAQTFMNNFLEAMEDVCDVDGKTTKNTLSSAWAEQASAFTNLNATAKDFVFNASSKSEDEISKAFAESYEYIYGKYGTEYGLTNFLNRTISSSNKNYLISINNVSSSTWVIVAVAVVGIAAVGVFFIYRKRKEI